MITGSFLAIGALFSLDIISLETIQNGLMGNENMQPWKILVIFFTVAYASVSTDITGIFDVIALKIVQFAKGNTSKLFLFFYFFASILTVFTSNDIVILTLTPIIFYLGKHAKLNILPFLFAEFFGANTLSMMLVIGNPTNIIVAESLQIGFFEYFTTMFFPTLFAACLNYGLLRWYFSKDLQKKYTLNKDNHFHVQSFIDVGLSAILMILMLYTLVLSEKLGIEMWLITTIFGGIFLMEDIAFYLYRKNKRNHSLAEKSLYEETPHKSDLELAFIRMPWGIAPFIVAFFILVSGFSQTEIFHKIALLISSFSQNLFSGIFSMGITSFFSANVINNQPMTILFSSIMLSQEYTHSVSSEISEASGYALVIASNLGANFTLLGALAGLMWKNILHEKGFSISYFEFVKVGASITLVVFFSTLLVLWGIFLL